MDLNEAIRLAKQWEIDEGEGWREVLKHLLNYINLLESREKFYLTRIYDLEGINDELRKQSETLQKGIPATKS